MRHALILALIAMTGCGLKQPRQDMEQKSAEYFARLDSRTRAEREERHRKGIPDVKWSPEAKEANDKELNSPTRPEYLIFAPDGSFLGTVEPSP